MFLYLFQFIFSYWYSDIEWYYVLSHCTFKYDYEAMPALSNIVFHGAIQHLWGTLGYCSMSHESSSYVLDYESSLGNFWGLFSSTIFYIFCF